MELSIYNIEGKDTGKTVSLSEGVFAMETPNDHAIYMDVKHIMANRRQGTHKAKERGEVSGSKRKPYRQKGTGNARAGNRRSPLWRHGGRIFGPRPRGYGFRMNKKEKALARKSALTYKAREEGIKIVESFTFEAPKTSQMLGILNNLEARNGRVLLVLADLDKMLYLSTRNLPNASVVTAANLNTYDILSADTVLLSEDAVGIINEKLA